MASKPKTTRRRKDRADKAAREDRDASASPDEGRAVEVKIGPEARGETAPEQRDEADEPAAEPRGLLDMDGLEALADMDRDELDSLLGESVSRPDYDEGEQVTGPITRIGYRDAFVDLGGKSEGALPVAELKEGERVGDLVTAWVLSADEEGVQLTRELTGHAAETVVEEAAETGAPVEGTVRARNKGGFDIQIGSVRAFCPVSQIERYPVDDDQLDAYVGRTLSFKVIETGDDVVVSRRELQEENLAEGRDEFWATVEEGDTHSGVVTSVQPWGVFVDIEGVEGLVHRSELGWEQVDDASTRVRRGQSLAVRVIGVDRQSRKLSLSAKDPSASPWARVGTDFIEGGTYSGVVRGVEPYGAFVEIAPGLQGLLHVSRRTGREGSLPRVDAEIDVKLVGIDLDRRRLELADPDWSEGSGSSSRSSDEEWRSAAASTDDQSLGTLGDLLGDLKLDD